MPTDKVVLLLIAEGVPDIYGKEAKERMGEELGLGKAIDNSTVQNALRRMSAMTLITKIDRGRYQFEDEAFADWARELEMRE